MVSEIDHGGLGVHAERCGDKLGPLVAATRSFSRGADMAHNRARGTGPAREFTDAFDAADRLVELAASDVLGQLTIHGRPLLLQHVTDIDLEPGTPRRAHFTVPYDPWLDTGELIQIDDPLVTDTCLLNRTTINLGSGPSRLSAQILPGTASLWEATSHSPI